MASLPQTQIIISGVITMEYTKTLALLQLSVLFPNFENSENWKTIANDRLDLHVAEDFTNLEFTKSTVHHTIPSVDIDDEH